MNIEAVPEGYWRDAQGNLIPDANVKDMHKLEDQMVRGLVAKAIILSKELATFKRMALDEAVVFRQLIAEKYGAKRGGKKGNMTLRSYDGQFEMQVAISETISFGPELQAAKDLVDACLERWSVGASDNLKTMVNSAFQVGKEGRIDTGRVLALRQYEITDREWQRAMDAIGDAVRVTGSKTYVRFYQTDTETGVRSAISLDLAAV